jgi:hypothetical protein
MNFLELKRLRQLATGILTFTTVLVLILGFWLWGSVFARPSRTLAKIDSRVGKNKVQSVRHPAAVSPAIMAQPLSATPAKIETMALECLKDGQNVFKTTTARQLRLKMDLCHGRAANLEKSNVLNRSNGFEATLFQMEQGHVSSDYINLVDGENQIAMKFIDDKGRSISTTITVSRPAPL